MKGYGADRVITQRTRQRAFMPRNARGPVRQQKQVFVTVADVRRLLAESKSG